MSTLRIIELDSLESNTYQTVTLSGVDYDLRLLWNERAQLHFLKISDSEGMIASVPLTLFLDLLMPIPGTRKPPGFLCCWTTEQGADEAGLRDLGRTHFLIYIDPDDPVYPVISTPLIEA